MALKISKQELKNVNINVVSIFFKLYLCQNIILQFIIKKLHNTFYLCMILLSLNNLTLYLHLIITTQNQ